MGVPKPGPSTGPRHLLNRFLEGLMGGPGSNQYVYGPRVVGLMIFVTALAALAPGTWLRDVTVTPRDVTGLLEYGLALSAAMLTLSGTIPVLLRVMAFLRRLLRLLAGFIEVLGQTFGRPPGTTPSGEPPGGGGDDARVAVAWSQLSSLAGRIPTVLADVRRGHAETSNDLERGEQATSQMLGALLRELDDLRSTLQGMSPTSRQAFERASWALWELVARDLDSRGYTPALLHLEGRLAAVGILASSGGRSVTTPASAQRSDVGDFLAKLGAWAEQETKDDASGERDVLTDQTLGSAVVGIYGNVVAILLALGGLTVNLKPTTSMVLAYLGVVVWGFGESASYLLWQYHHTASEQGRA